MEAKSACPTSSARNIHRRWEDDSLPRVSTRSPSAPRVQSVGAWKARVDRIATYQTLDDPPLPFQLQDQSRRYDADDGAVNGNSAAAAGRGAPAEPGSRPK